jgi:hypothetical protein
MNKITKSKAINKDGKDTLLIDCYRVKVEYKPDGKMRFYFFNCSGKEHGDSCIEIDEQITEVDVHHEKEKSFVFTNPFVNPSKRFKNDKSKEKHKSEVT